MVESLTSNPFGFMLAMVYYDGQSTQANDIESGLHLLMNMACYEGKEMYRPNVAVKKMRIKCAVEIIVCLFLADINSHREKVLKHIIKFKDEKEKPSRKSKKDKKVIEYEDKSKKDKEVIEDEVTTPNSQLVVTPEYLDIPAIDTKRARRIKLALPRKKMKKNT